MPKSIRLRVITEYDRINKIINRNVKYIKYAKSKNDFQTAMIFQIANQELRPILDDLYRIIYDRYLIKDVIMSSRLKNILHAYFQGTGLDLSITPISELSKLITKDKFLKVRNAGIKSWKEYQAILITIGIIDKSEIH